MRHIMMWAFAALLFAAWAGDVRGQRPRPGVRPPRSPNNGREEEPPPRPSDPRLIELHKEFLTKAEKLASEYEHKKQNDKAREVYEAILRLVPRYSKAEEGLKRITEVEATTDREVVEVQANRAWQDTGVVLQKGKPVHIEARGTWTFQMSHKVPAGGIEIPRELRDFNLGALVGVVVSPADEKEPKPFLIGAEKNFVADKTGKLLLRMYDSDPGDNTGKLSVTIQSTFAKKD